MKQQADPTNSTAYMFFSGLLQELQEGLSFSTAPDNWEYASFPGTYAENFDFLSELINETISIYGEARKSRYPDDPVIITDDIKSTGEYKEMRKRIKTNLRLLVNLLNTYDTPFHSIRYQGHMNWDLAIPAIAGYFAAMLHNPNNVTVQASTLTTYLEIAAAGDICSMIGFDKNSWAHITCDGTVANIEALWSARELKLIPLAMQDAVLNEDSLKKAKGIKVMLPDGSDELFIKLNTWELLNLTSKETLGLPGKISKATGLDEFRVWDLFHSKYSPNTLGITEFTRRYLEDYRLAIAVPSTKHYSWVKGPALIGIGSMNMNTSEIAPPIINIPVDKNARMNISEYKKVIEYCSDENNRIALFLVVSVMGSTEESAVDPLGEILEIRKKYRKAKNFNFNIHADAAYGGYLITGIRKSYPLAWPFSKTDEPGGDIFIRDRKEVPVSDYVLDQMEEIRNTDSVTIDPHKWGYIPYSAGSISYKDKRMINLTTFGASYIGKPGLLPSVGDYGVEGSKPGAAPAAVFLTNSVIRPDITGYGRIINNTVFNSKIFFLSLLFMAGEEDPFISVPLADLSVSKEKCSGFFEKYKNTPMPGMMKDRYAAAIIKESGPDQNMVDYAFNYYVYDENGKKLNSDIKKINEFNSLIFQKLHIKEGKPTGAPPLMVSMTTFERTNYGDEFIDNFACKLGAENSSGITEINCLRSTVMDPWLCKDSTLDESYINTIIIPALRKAVLESLKEIL